MRLPFLCLQLEQAFGMAIDPSEQLQATVRSDELVQRIGLAVPFDVAETQRVDLDDVSAKHLDQGQHASRVGDDHAILHMKLARIGRKFEAGQYRVLSLGDNLIFAELGHVLVAPGVPVLGVVNHPATDFATVNHIVDDVGTGSALAYPLDQVAFEFLPKASAPSPNSLAVFRSSWRARSASLPVSRWVSSKCLAFTAFTASCFSRSINSAWF
jgi:hypothetical protein